MAKGNSNSLAIPIPTFTGENYDVWSIKMKTYFLSQDLWDIVNDGFYEPTDTVSESEQQQEQLKESKKNDAAALFILQQATDDNTFPKISRAQNAKEAWVALKEEFQGNIPQTTSLAEGRGLEDLKKYLPLYKAILEDNLNYIRELCHQDQNALEARITKNLDTALYVAVGSKANHIVEYLLNNMSLDQVSLKNKEGNTVLSIAAIVGNVVAANMILNKDKDKSLIHSSNNSKRIPLIEATRHGQKKMVNYLLSFSSYDSVKRFTSGVLLAKLLIIAEFNDLTLELLKECPSLATTTYYGGESLLSEITKKLSAFPSGGTRKLPFWKYVPISMVTSYTKKIEETKLMHYVKVLELIRYLCKEIANDKNDYTTTSLILKGSLLLAAELGVYEVVVEIINAFPDAIWFTNEKNHNVFHLAVINRQEKVFSLIYKMKGRKHLLLMSQDVNKNNILHLAGKLAPKNQLNLIPGAALQMQRELRWFKEVEKIVQPDYKEEKNSKAETPAMLFTEEHKELVKEGEKWMKDAATSCSVAAALIATVVFAAAITVPGDYNNNGQPTFHKLPSFTLFGISDAFSLFSSIAAIIMFLSVLTARYAEDDFRRSLPNRLILGLVMLFLSLTSLMVTFCATVFLVFFDKKKYWILALAFASALLPLALFVYSQFPLLRDVFNSTYGPGIFCKQSNRQEKKC